MNPVLVTLIQNAALLLKLPWEAARRVLGGIGLPMHLVYPIATIALGWLLANHLQRKNATGSRNPFPLNTLRKGWNTCQ